MAVCDYTGRMTETSEDTPLSGRTVLVTGGAHRVGGAISRHLGALGARVHVAYHGSAGAARELVDSLPHGGWAHAADLETADGAERLLAACTDTGAAPDAVVHAAASFLDKRVADTTAADWDRVFALNTRAFFLLARELASLHGVEGGVRSGEGAAAERDLSLVAIADSGALELWPGYAAHCVSKAALLPLVQLLAKALAPAVRVNAVIPGPVLPEPGASRQQVAAMAGRTLLGRVGEADDVARAVAYLLTNRFCTATLLEVTGGAHLWRGNLGGE
jgi:pteridine reductase